MTLEVCVETLQSIIAAKAGGAHRIELCTALSEDGLTPSYGMIQSARRLGPEKLHVLIRPRSGNFVYNEEEVNCMITDIQAAHELGADGVVIGALTPEGDIDILSCQRMMQAATGMQVTFHRAFDQCCNPFQALEDIISLGCHRLLTSGQAPTALEGIPMLKKLVSQAGNRIIIMPAAGVSQHNAHTILKQTGATEIHGSLRTNGVTDPAIIKQILS